MRSNLLAIVVILVIFLISSAIYIAIAFPILKIVI
jgi:hypothetical protein